MDLRLSAFDFRLESRPAVFLDRDGVLNRDRDDFVKSLDEFELFPEAVRAVAQLSQAGLAVVVVSNQSGIARGFVTEAAAEAMMEGLRAAVETEGGKIDGIYQCPHGPNDACDCRKPLPGLLLRAARDLRLDLSRSVMVGDSERDLEAGKAAGCKVTVLVLTGKTPQDSSRVWLRWKTPPDHVAAQLGDAVQWILDRTSGEGPSA